MNPYLTVEPESRQAANRYYGRVDSVEVLDNQAHETLVQLDAVSADVFDDEPFSGIPFTAAADRLPLATLEISTLNIPPDQQSMREFMRPGRWLEVRVARPTRVGVDVDYYPGLFSDAITRASEITEVDSAIAKRLSKAFSMDDIPDDTNRQIMDVLNRVRPAAFINVFDVGQGNMNALWECGGGAVLYFDFGGGVTANKQTYPKKPVVPCFTRDPPVVLSHWDWDHWSSVGRFPEALDLHWIAPRCEDPGPYHRALAWELHRRGRLHIWPRGMREFNGSYFHIEKCTGSGRNDSGLVMTVSGRRGTDFESKVLLSADAAYDCIPEIKNRTRFSAIVASHHGAVVSSISEVKPRGKDSVLIYSVGHGNGFCHPRLQAELEYLQSGWVPTSTYSTSQRIRNRPSSIAIRISPQPPESGCGLCTPKISC